MRPGVFNVQNQTEWPLFTTVEETRKKFSQGTKVLVAIGGWGDTEGFEEAAKTEAGRRRFAENVGRMVDETGSDGMCVVILGR
jgi:GH18 family chitinase